MWLGRSLAKVKNLSRSKGVMHGSEQTVNLNFFLSPHRLLSARRIFNIQFSSKPQENVIKFETDFQQMLLITGSTLPIRRWIPLAFFIVSCTVGRTPLRLPRRFYYVHPLKLLWRRQRITRIPWTLEVGARVRVYILGLAQPLYEYPIYL